MRYKEADGERCDLKDLLGQRLRSQPKEKDTRRELCTHESSVP